MSVNPFIASLQVVAFFLFLPPKESKIFYSVPKLLRCLLHISLLVGGHTSFATYFNT